MAKFGGFMGKLGLLAVGTAAVIGAADKWGSGDTSNPLDTFGGSTRDRVAAIVETSENDQEYREIHGAHVSALGLAKEQQTKVEAVLTRVDQVVPTTPEQSGGIYKGVLANGSEFALAGNGLCIIYDVDGETIIIHDGDKNGEVVDEADVVRAKDAKTGRIKTPRNATEYEAQSAKARKLYEEARGIADADLPPAATVNPHKKISDADINSYLVREGIPPNNFLSVQEMPDGTARITYYDEGRMEFVTEVLLDEHGRTQVIDVKTGKELGR
ncbi:MAG TPA: hypothetical protein VIT68_05245 [Candidatus Gracilibacteria bacterium]